MSIFLENWSLKFVLWLPSNVKVVDTRVSLQNRDWSNIFFNVQEKYIDLSGSFVVFFVVFFLLFYFLFYFVVSQSAYQIPKIKFSYICRFSIIFSSFKHDF